MSSLGIIGAGPGGYTAALYAALKGIEVILFEREHVGGTCLNWGCIPTKTLLASSDIFRKIGEAEEFGIKTGDVTVDYNAVFARKDNIVRSLRSGIELLIKKRKIRLIRGNAVLEKDGSISCNGENFRTSNTIIATGSTSAEIPGISTDGKFILNSTHALDMKDIPENILIVGGGVIGVEFAGLWAAFGKKVTIIELSDSILPMADRDISKRLSLMLKKQGIKINTGQKIEKMEVIGDKVHVSTGTSQELVFDKVLVAVGRKLELDSVKMELEKEGRFVKVDSGMKTSVHNVYAIGDIVSGMQLAHVASSQAFTAVNNILGQECHFSYKAVPSCVYTHPEAAWVGMTEKDAIELENGNIRKGLFRFNALGKAMAIGENDGFIKIIADLDDNLLGVHMLGPKVTELIGEAVTAVASRLKVYEWSGIIHAHPTLSEGVMEAVHDVHGECVYNL